MGVVCVFSGVCACGVCVSSVMCVYGVVCCVCVLLYVWCVCVGVVWVFVAFVCWAHDVSITSYTYRLTTRL